MSDIFISYARSDRARAQALAEALEQQGYSVWWDFEIIPGERFSKVIEKELDKAKCVIVLWSKESVESKWVETEAAEGERQNKLVPVLIDEVTIPLAFRQIHTANLTDWEKGKPHSDFTSILKAIAEIAVVPPACEPIEDVKPKPAPPKTEAPSPEPIVPRRKLPIILALGTLIGLALLVLVGVLVYTQQRETITNSIGMNFVFIPAGSFMMGSPPDEGERKQDEVQHQVTISKPFYMQTTEVTQGQYNKVMDDTPSHFSDCGDDCPVEKVSWEDAQNFIRKLNDMEGTNKYRLPTEAEWEYACRAGSLTTYSFGNNTSELRDYAWYSGNSDSKTHRVGQKKPNAWGLYDMHGNVWEWCQDWHGDYPTGHVTDPKGSSSDKVRVLRGGSWARTARYLRSAFRNRDYPGNRYHDHGFRVARDL